MLGWLLGALALLALACLAWLRLAASWLALLALGGLLAWLLLGGAWALLACLGGGLACLLALALGPCLLALGGACLLVGNISKPKGKDACTYVIRDLEGLNKVVNLINGYMRTPKIVPINPAAPGGRGIRGEELLLLLVPPRMSIIGGDKDPRRGN